MVSRPRHIRARVCLFFERNGGLGLVWPKRANFGRVPRRGSGNHDGIAQPQRAGRGLRIIKEDWAHGTRIERAAGSRVGADRGVTLGIGARNATATSSRSCAGCACRSGSTGRTVAGQAQTPSAALPPILANDPKMKPILKMWERQSAQLTSLRVDIDRVDDDPAWGDKIPYKGVAYLQSPNCACLNFAKATLDPKTGKPVVDPKSGKPTFVQHERIICTGEEVWQYKSDTKQIFIFPLDKENQKRALEEGPLPFLFNMRAADAEARYVMNLLHDKPDYYVIGVFPKLKIDKESFSQALLQLNKKTFFPDRIVLIAPDGKSKKWFTLTNLQPNLQIPAENFQGKPIGKPWVIVRDLPEEAAPPRRVGATGPGGSRRRGASAVRSARSGNLRGDRVCAALHGATSPRRFQKWISRKFIGSGAS